MSLLLCVQLTISIRNYIDTPRIIQSQPMQKEGYHKHTDLYTCLENWWSFTHNMQTSMEIHYDRKMKVRISNACKTGPLGSRPK